MQGMRRASLDVEGAAGGDKGLPDHLAPGMTADGSIIIDQRAGVLRLPRAVAHAHADGSAQVQVWANGQATTRTIQVGLRGDSFVEVTAGLQEGELVIAQ